MKTTAVLVVGRCTKRTWLQVVETTGLLPLVRHDMTAALDKIRHERFTAIVLDRGYERIDALEFVLNVRDLDQHTPIFVVGPSDDRNANQVLAQQNEVYLVGDMFALGNQLDQVAPENEESAHSEIDESSEAFPR